MQFFADYGLFLAKIVTWVIAVLILVGGIIAIASKGKERSKERLVIKKLNEKYSYIAQELNAKILSKAEFKQFIKEKKKQEKAQAKDTSPNSRKRIFVLDFDGDIKASAVTNLREEITAILTVAKPVDEVLVRIESAGGLVHTYGLAASQLQRIKAKNIPLTVAVDKVAASGGYLMACVADRILAAPFAIIGSIGVLAQLPNFNRLLKKNHIDFEQITAGEYKRTLTLFGENTDKAREKFREDLEQIHQHFKQFILQHRQHIDIQQVATGEHWIGKQALDLKLVDELRTSDDFLLSTHPDADLYHIHYCCKKSLSDKLSAALQGAINKALATFQQ